MPLVHSCRAILLDLCNTIMLGCDRFGAKEDFKEDFAATYKAAGGTELAPAGVNRLMAKIVRAALRGYHNPALFDSFPLLRFWVDEICEPENIPQKERALLEEVFAQHEIGVIPEHHTAVIHQLAARFPIGLVSNNFGRTELFIQELQRAGISEDFRCMIFSREVGAIKPSPLIFRMAMEKFDASPNQFLFIGDSLRCDVGGAAAVGMNTIWIAEKEAHHIIPISPSPNRIVFNLSEILDEF